MWICSGQDMLNNMAIMSINSLVQDYKMEECGKP